MTREELITSLAEWKHGSDPEARLRKYFIEEYGDKNNNTEKITIQLNGKEIDSIIISHNDSGSIIIEDKDNPILSGYISTSKFREYLLSL